MSSERMLRVNELLKREIGMIYEEQMPGRFAALVTVLAVKTAPDLRHAKVSVSVLGASDELKHQIPTVLNKHKALFQAELAKRVKLKYTPVLQFVLDETLAKADHLLQLLDEVQQASPAVGDAEESTPS